MNADLVIGLDSSTTATKAIAWDRNGQVVAEGRAMMPLNRPQPGWFEQEATDWTSAACKALKQLTRKVGGSRIAAIAISNQRESFAQFDAEDRPLRPGTLWLDERAHQEVKDLSAALGADAIHRMSGKPPDITACIYRCLWLSRHFPKIWKDTAKTAEVHGVLTHFLTGQWHTSLSSADPMGLVDIATCDWSNSLLKAVDLHREQLPKLYRTGEIMGEVSPQAAKQTGLKAGTLVVAGGGDGQCAGTGANIFEKGRAYLNLGTACVSGSFGLQPIVHRSIRTLQAAAENGYTYETVIRTGTFLVNWMVSRLFNCDPARNPKIFEQLEAEALSSPVGAGGLALVPYWSGSMSPYWDVGARGVIAGLSSNHSRGDLYRAVLEGITLEQVMMTNHVAEATSAVDHFVVMGGGAQSDFWCQMIADAAGRDVKRLETVEASALGAGMAAAKGAGWFDSVAKASRQMSGKTSLTFRARKKNHKSYVELLAIYSDLWPAVSKWNARMQEFSERHHG